MKLNKPAREPAASERDWPGAMESSSSGSMSTYVSSPATSAPLTISAYATSLPVRSLTLLFRTRSLVPFWNW